MAEGYTIKSIDEFEEMEGSGGATWRLARKTLGAEAFGFNVVDIEAGGEIPAHDHAGDNQEEVFIILDGQRDPLEHDAPRGPGRRAHRREGRMARGRRDPLRGRPDQAQGRLLGLRLDPPPGRPARLVEIRP